MALDKNADGKLSRDELVEGYSTIYGDRERAVREVEVIMEKVDVDHNGYIDYSGIRIAQSLGVEFLIASTNKKKVLSKENLKRAFQLFDKVQFLLGAKVGREREDLGQRDQADPGSGKALRRGRVVKSGGRGRPEQRRPDLLRRVREDDEPVPRLRLSTLLEIARCLRLYYYHCNNNVYSHRYSGLVEICTQAQTITFRDDSLTRS